MHEPELIPVAAGGARIYVEAHQLRGIGDEREIVGAEPAIEQVIDGLTAFARQVTARMAEAMAGVDRVTLEFGCEVGLESGSLVAIVGKASGRSTIKVGLEWNRQQDSHTRG